jgi:hypothetical protein
MQSERASYYKAGNGGNIVIHTFLIVTSILQGNIAIFYSDGNITFLKVLLFIATVILYRISEN